MIEVFSTSFLLIGVLAADLLLGRLTRIPVAIRTPKKRRKEKLPCLLLNFFRP